MAARSPASSSAAPIKRKSTVNPVSSVSASSPQQVPASSSAAATSSVAGSGSLSGSPVSTSSTTNNNNPSTSVPLGPSSNASQPLPTGSLGTMSNKSFGSPSSFSAAAAAATTAPAGNNGSGGPSTTYKTYSSVASSQPLARAQNTSTATPAGPGAHHRTASAAGAATAGAGAGPTTFAGAAQKNLAAGTSAQQPSQVYSQQPSAPVEVKIFSAHGKRILCVAEIRGKLSKLNAMAKKYNASCIIHSGNFGFFDSNSISRISLKIIKQLCVFSPLLDTRTLPQDPEEIKKTIAPDSLSELPSFISGAQHLNVPVYTIYGAAEDLTVLEKFKEGVYKVPNLYIIDETTTHTIQTPSGLTLRLFGLGGSFVNHRLFDHGDGTLSIAGSPGVMWTTVLQMGQLISTVKRSFDPTEVRIFVSHPSPSREGLLAQLALSLRSDFTISSGLHFLYGSSFNETSALPSIDHFKSLLASSRAQFMELWNAVKTPLFSLVDEAQKQQLMLAYETFEAMPVSPADSKTSPTSTTIPTAASTPTNPPSSTPSPHQPLDYIEVAFRNMWHFNLCDAEYGALVLNVAGGRVSSESYSEGFNFQYRFPRAQTAGITATTAIVSVPNSNINNQQAGTAVPATTATAAQPAQQTTPTTTPATLNNSLDKSSRYSSRSILKNTSSPSSTSTFSKSDSKRPTQTVPAVAETTLPNGDIVELPGVWVPNGLPGREEVQAYFHPDDQKNIRAIILKDNYMNRDKMFALVYFSTEEQAIRSLERINREKAGKASIIKSGGGNSGGLGGSRSESRSTLASPAPLSSSTSNGRSSHRGGSGSSAAGNSSHSNGWGPSLSSSSSRGRGGLHRGRSERGEPRHSTRGGSRSTLSGGAGSSTTSSSPATSASTQSTSSVATSPGSAPSKGEPATVANKA